MIMIACVMMVFMMDLVINVHIGGGVLLVCTSGFGFVCWYVLHFTLVHNYINNVTSSKTEKIISQTVGVLPRPKSIPPD